MSFKRTLKLSALIFFMIIILQTSVIQAKVPQDIQNHWAQDYIMTLLDNNIMETNQNNEFEPDSAISRGEFAIALAKQQSILETSTNQFSDLNTYKGRELINALVKRNIMSGYPDNTFRPEQAINRAEAVVSIIKTLGIKGDQEIIKLNDYNPFTDISDDHWGSNYIKIAAKLNLLTINSEKKFNGNRAITKAEAAKLIAILEDLSGQTAYITDIYPSSQKIAANLLEGERKIFSISDNSLIGRNNRIVGINEILKTDKVFIVTQNEEAIYLKAYGMVTKKDLTTEVSKITKGIFEPEEIEQLAEGNIDILEPKLLNGVKNQLKNEGLTDDEINAIMNTEWGKLEELSKQRLSEAVSIQTGLPLIITRGLFDGDWEKIKSYAQIEVIQRVIQQLLSSQLIS